MYHHPGLFISTIGQQFRPIDSVKLRSFLQLYGDIYQRLPKSDHKQQRMRQ